MKVKILQESGTAPALQGLALSYNSEPSMRVADRLAHKGGGESKFLEHVDVWLMVTATRKWWSQADTYRLSTKQSESTMHTLLRRELTAMDFSVLVDHRSIDIVNEYIREKDLDRAKDNLPEGFLQTREWKLPYSVLQNMYNQRHTHKLPEWQYFIDAILDQAKHPHWIKPC